MQPFKNRRLKNRPVEQRKLRTAHLLPSLFTSGNIACGIASILLSSDSKFELAGWLILAGCMFDVLDGRVAKLFRTCSDFGVQLDSLADAITFGIAPAVLCRSMLYEPHSRLGFSLAILYGLCTALRLARYNLMVLMNKDKVRTHFVGLPCPVAAALLASLAIVLREFDVETAQGHIKFGIHILIIGLSVVMVSRIRYPDLIALHVERHSAFNHLVVVAVVLSLGIIYPPETVLIGSLAFVVGGPFLLVFVKPKSENLLPESQMDDVNSELLDPAQEETLK